MVTPLLPSAESVSGQPLPVGLFDGGGGGGGGYDDKAVAMTATADYYNEGFEVTDDGNYSDWQHKEMYRYCGLYNFIMYTVVGGLVCSLGCVGNILAFIVFCCDKVKTSTSFLFQVLSVIDTLLLLTALPLYSVTNFLEYTELSDSEQTQKAKECLLPFAFIVQTATIWVTVLVAFNRYIAVCQPFKAARLCTVVQAKRQLSVVLLLSVLYNIPKFAEVFTELGDIDLYFIIYSNILYLIFLLILPLLSLTIVNVRLITALKELKRKRQEMQQSARQAQDNNVTLVLIIVVIVFSVCQAPALMNQIFWNVLLDDARDCGGFQFYFSRVSNLLVMINSAVNFPIYTIFNTRFRQVLVQILQGYCGCSCLGLNSVPPVLANNRSTAKGGSVAVGLMSKPAQTTRGNATTNDCLTIGENNGRCHVFTGLGAVEVQMADEASEKAEMLITTLL